MSSKVLLMLRPEDSERTWKPEYILGQYQDAIRCAEQRGDHVAVRALKGAFLCAWNRAVLRTYGGRNRL
jgi:hypothetical protein